VLPTSNRGRDILPFIKIMPEVLKAGHEFLIKIHTKKSIHREDGDTWRKDIFDKLLSDSALTANLAQLANYPDIGILGPADHIVPMHSYMGANEVNVTKLAARLGVGRDALENLSFVAGTMFTARTKAIIPLMNIALAETDFEAEVKQIDGTLAHAFERAFSISAHTVGLTVKSPNNTITENYRFVNTSVDYTKTQE
jgi:lipopolysaccharide biosynthesis protein